MQKEAFYSVIVFVNVSCAPRLVAVETVFYWKVAIVATIIPSVLFTAYVHPRVSTASANIHVTEEVFVQIFVIVKIIHNKAKSDVYPVIYAR